MQSRFMTAVPAGFHTVAPYLFVNGAAKAIEFYKRAFGAVDVSSPFVEPQSGKAFRRVHAADGEEKLTPIGESPTAV